MASAAAWLFVTSAQRKLASQGNECVSFDCCPSDPLVPQLQLQLQLQRRRQRQRRRLQLPHIAARRICLWQRRRKTIATKSPSPLSSPSPKSPQLPFKCKTDSFRRYWAPKSKESEGDRAGGRVGRAQLRLVLRTRKISLSLSFVVSYCNSKREKTRSLFQLRETSRCCDNFSLYLPIKAGSSTPFPFSLSQGICRILESSCLTLLRVEKGREK